MTEWPSVKAGAEKIQPRSDHFLTSELGTIFFGIVILTLPADDQSPMD
jgi:hypothetical protein